MTSDPQQNDPSSYDVLHERLFATIQEFVNDYGIPRVNEQGERVVQVCDEIMTDIVSAFGWQLGYWTEQFGNAGADTDRIKDLVQEVVKQGREAARKHQDAVVASKKPVLPS